MILLDTDILSALMKPRVSQALVERLASFPAEAIFISAMTQSEILYGLQRLPEGTKKRKQVETSAEILDIYADNCLQFDLNTASVLAEIRVAAAKQGKTLPLADAIIASTAMQHDLTLMTHNVRHFKNIAHLKVSDPLAS